MDLGDEEKNWLRRLGVFTGKEPPFPDGEDEKDGEVEESLVDEEAADRRGIAGTTRVTATATAVPGKNSLD